MSKYRIIFLGTPEFAVPALKALITSRQSPVAVITEPDRPAGRGGNLVMSPVKLIAEGYHIPIYQPKKISNLKSQISNLQPEVAIVVAYGQIIPKEILKIPKFGFINIHPSLLPKYRGPSPIQAAILNGDQETGVSIIKLDEKMDHGDVVATEGLKNERNKELTCPALSEKLAILGAKLLLKTLTPYLSGKIKLTGQDRTQATYTKLIKKSDGLIDWDEPIEKIERKIRAYNPWPSTYTILNGQRLKICQAHSSYGKLIVDQVQLEGKKQVSWDNFIRGYKKKIPFIDKINWL